MRVEDFLRLYPLRSPNVMWLLGAGASASAGIPTALHMIWDFKRSLYCSAQRVSVRLCSDLSNPTLRVRLQQQFDSTGRFPAENSEDEYASYFEAAYPAEQDRRRHIDSLVSGVTPSYGHAALAALLRLDKARIVWTTNFDRLIEDASILALGSSGKIVVATLDSPQLAMQAMNEGRWPLLVKLHGDFQSRRLKNTGRELKSQDEELRRALIEACKRFGLAVVGYSGRDNSIMDALDEAVDADHSYPFGLFWFNRSDGPCLPRVSKLITRASARGIDAHIINVETFDELVADAILLIPDIPHEVEEQLRAKAQRVSDAPVPGPGNTWPVIRLNALPILEWPRVARLVGCDIGGTREVREAVAQSGALVVAARRQVGVIAFGSDGEIRRAFGNNNIKEFDLHAIAPHRLRLESAEQGLLYEALCHALTRHRPLTTERRGRFYLAAVDTARANDDLLLPLRKTLNAITGTVPGSQLRWSEAVKLRLEYRFERLWLLITPTVWVERTALIPATALSDQDEMDPINAADATAEKADALVKEFIRGRLVTRYNATWNAVLDAWIALLLAGNQKLKVSTFGIADGVDASFTISGITAFSRRGRR